MINREYIKTPKPVALPSSTTLLRVLNDETWQSIVLYHILSFYKNHDSDELKNKITQEQQKKYPRVEREIAKYIRKYLRNDREFSLNLRVDGESTNDEDIEGNYDIVINNTYWKNSFFFECKNLSLNPKRNLIAEYVYVKSKRDGGVYRHFNGKYALHQNFAGMLGFVLEGDVTSIRDRIVEAMKTPFDITPEGDFVNVEFDSIEGNNFTFNSIHKRSNVDFKLFHILLDFVDK